MEWLNILKSQQDDFCQRISSEKLLYADGEYFFSELVIITEKNLQEIIHKCSQFIAEYQSVDPDIDLFNNCFKKELIKYTIQKIYGDLLLPNNDENINIFDDYLIFILKSNPQIKVITKMTNNLSSPLRWFFKQEEISNNQILLCFFSLQNIHDKCDKYEIVLGGFLPSKLQKNLYDNSSIIFTINNLLYCGGLRGYLNSLIPHEYYYLNLAKQANHNGDYLTAIANYNQAIKLNYNNAKSHLFRAISRWKIGDKEGALADCIEATRLDPNNDLAYHWRGYINFKLGNYPEALTDYTEEIKINSLSTYAYYRRGFIQEKLHNLLNAFEDYSQAINLNKNLYQAYYNRGNIRYELKDRQGALEDFNQALKLNPNLPQAYYNIAIIYVDLGELEKAIKHYELAIKLMPNYGKANYNLLILYADLGQKKKALEVYQKLIKFNPDFELINILKEDLLQYLMGEKQLPSPPKKPISSINKQQKSLLKKDKIKLEKPVELSPENMPYNELIIIDRDEQKKEENPQKSIEKKLIDPWNTKQY